MNAPLQETSQADSHWKAPTTAQPSVISGDPAAGRAPVERSATPALSRLHGFRRFTQKIARRAKHMTGRPDNSPWVLEPGPRRSKSAYVDFIFGLDYVSPNSPLVAMLHKAMAPYGISMLPVNATNVESVIEQVRRGWLQPHVFLDLCSAVDQRFGDLATAAVEKGVYVIDDPRELSSWTLKAPAQPRLEAAGLPVPATVIFPKGSPDRELSAEELAKIGPSCVLKPSYGWANRGVVVGVAPTRENIAKARDFDRSDDWLVQKKIAWTRFGDRPAYIRAYHLLGHRSLMWWSREDGHDRYELFTWDDLRKYDLLPAVEIIDRIAGLTGIDFFSSEIAITAESGKDRLVLIDYINDQCDMDPEVRPMTTPVPEEWVQWVCTTVADFVWRRKHGLPRDGRRTLTLFGR